MPVIRVEMFQGRDSEQKEIIIGALTQAFTSVTGANPESVHVILTDIDKQNWGRGGQSFSKILPDD